MLIRDGMRACSRCRKPIRADNSTDYCQRNYECARLHRLNWHVKRERDEVTGDG